MRISGKPADAEHQYGHGKVESVAALAETALLFLLAAGVAFEAAQRLFGAANPMVEATPYAFAVIVVSIVVDFFRARTLSRVAEATSSQALEADALHFSSDLLSSIAVLIGLVAARQWKLLGAYAAAAMLAFLALSVTGNGIAAPRWHFDLSDRLHTVLSQFLDDPRWIAMLAAVIVHTFNYNRDFYIPEKEVARVESARTRLLAAHV